MNYNFKYINSEPLYFFVVSNENLKKKKIKEIFFESRQFSNYNILRVYEQAFIICHGYETFTK